MRISSVMRGLVSSSKSRMIYPSRLQATDEHR
jgi:hypothetical protein